MVKRHWHLYFLAKISYNIDMYELVISTRRGGRYHAGVRDWREANAELARFQQIYFRNHPNDEIADAAVLGHTGERVARYNGRQLEMF